MSQRNTLVRSLHDLGLAAWFGGSLMGAVGLNGATAEARNPTERTRLSSIGWDRWAPVQIAALVAHGVGGVGLILGNKERLMKQGESRSNTAVKTVITGLAGAAYAYSAILGRRIANHSDEPSEGATEPTGGSTDELAGAQRQVKVLQWVVPALTAVLVVLAAQQGEQQRPIAGLLLKRR